MGDVGEEQDRRAKKQDISRAPRVTITLAIPVRGPPEVSREERAVGMQKRVTAAASDRLKKEEPERKERKKRER